MGYIGLLLIVVGETLSIAAEMLAAEQPTWSNGLKRCLPIITLGGFSLLAGYALAYLHLKDIWVIAAVSVGAILVIEPALAYLFFRTVPINGSLVGLILGITGIITTLAWK